MKQIIFLIDVGNARFLIEKNNNEYSLPTLEKQQSIRNIRNNFFKKYNLKIKEDNIEILKDMDNYVLVKTSMDDFIKSEKYETKILRDTYEIISNEIQKNILLEINKKIFFETINDSFWLGVILTAEDNIVDYQMKNILSFFLLHFSVIFC